MLRRRFLRASVIAAGLLAVLVPIGCGGERDDVRAGQAVSESQEASTTTPAESPPQVGGAPVLLDVHGSQGSLTLTFDQPVDPVAPNPTQPPAAGSEGLNTMYLTVFSADSGCSTPQGNAHYFMSGMGTPTVTVEATSIVAPTTYIRIAEGFVRSVTDGIYNQVVGCTAASISS